MQLENICLCKDLKSPKKLNLYSLVVPNNKVRTIITSLLIRQDLCNLQEYLKIENTATGKVFKDSQCFLELRYLAHFS